MVSTCHFDKQVWEIFHRCLVAVNGGFYLRNFIDCSIFNIIWKKETNG